MKSLSFLISSLFILSLFTSCGSNKDLQERAPAQFQQVYYTSGEDGMELHIPVVAIQDNFIELENVYFRGMKSPLVQDDEQTNLYVANFATGGGDRVMHEDPEEEYGNKAPQKPEKSPFKIDDDQAILEFSQNNQTRYYKITGIEERN